MSDNLFSLVRNSVRRPEATFIETSRGRRLSYAEAFATTGRLAHALRKLGVEPGDRVAVQVEKSPEAILLYLACLRAGAAFLPLNTAYTLAEIEWRCSGLSSGVAERSRPYGSSSLGDERALESSAPPR